MFLQILLPDIVLLSKCRISVIIIRSKKQLSGGRILILIRDIKLPVESGENEIKRKCAQMLGVSAEEIRNFSLSRLSVDARKKTNVHLVCSATLTFENEPDILNRVDGKNILPFESTEYVFPMPRQVLKTRPVVVGMGPAGLFAALQLAHAGLPPVIIERGKPVEQRMKDVDAFWESGVLSTESNVQFGEGGAGTFSDGKLTTGISDSRISHVFRLFVEHGAPRDILWSAKPHIGTDVLRGVVASIRRELLELGCDIRFDTKLCGLNTTNGALCAIELEQKSEKYMLDCEKLILALGHSARDTFKMLLGSRVVMEQKPFAIGVRIEHLQSEISRAQYGDFTEKLPPADYKLACHLPNGRSAYSFCVCPGGQVVAAASEEGELVTNGMSYRSRDGKNINGGFLVGLNPSDFPGNDPLAGVRLQQIWEKRAFTQGSGEFRSPAQRVDDFLKNRASDSFRTVTPSYLPGVTPTNICDCLPDYVTASLRDALPIFDRKLHGFASPDAVLTGIETRSSSPVRILRGADFQASIRGLYPCGEGAGYAGGITSAAVDGMKVAEAVANGE